MAIPTTSPQTRPARRWSLRRLATGAFGVLITLLLLIQLVPYGRDHTNPAVLAEPAWDSPQTRALFMRACADCHSNQTAWPWYSNVAPASWLIARDVSEGREAFNVSEWGRRKNDGDEAAGNVRENDMPPWFYLPLHAQANLTPEERQQFIAGLVATFGEEHEGPGGDRERQPGGGQDDDD